MALAPPPTPETQAPLPPRRDEAASAVADSNVRVDVGLLDKLMNLVGELVLARNQILQFGTHLEDSAFVTASQHLNIITTELQAQVMKTRMQPIGHVWNRLPRIVRDLAVECGKQIRIEMIGSETDLDRTILEAIKDPLTHIVRNAVDHGIESAEVRKANGKPRTGTLTLRAYHEGGQVNIEISDDGAGLDIEAIRHRAIERNLVPPDRASRMSDRELSQLIFLPGFSTAKKVTNVSGRGVGMDVVKTNIENIGGTVDLHSNPGTGTTLRIKIPLTLAIVPALVVTSAGQRYCIPQVSLVELVRLAGKEARAKIERVHGAPVYRLRGKLLPIVFLDDQLHREQAHVTDGADLDWELARAKHSQWKAKLRSFLDGESTLTEEEATSHRDCALGHWLYSGAYERMGRLPQMQELEAEHVRLHAMVKNVVDLKHAGRMAEAEAALGTIGPASKAINDQLSHLEQMTDAINIVVLSVDDRQFGMVVDEVNDTEEIVVKPLGKELKGIAVFAGATIMGDGQVALILDVLGLAQHSGAVGASRERGKSRLAEDEAAAKSNGSEKQALLLFGITDAEHMAVPLSEVARLEEFTRDRVETVGKQSVVQYRGEIMPLINLGAVDARKDTVRVIVHSKDDRSVGFVVDQVLDIVEESIRIQRHMARPGVIGSAVIQGKVTELLDVQGLIRTNNPGFVEERAA